MKKVKNLILISILTLTSLSMLLVTSAEIQPRSSYESLTVSGAIVTGWVNKGSKYSAGFTSSNNSSCFIQVWVTTVYNKTNYNDSNWGYNKIETYRSFQGAPSGVSATHKGELNGQTIDFGTYA